MPIFTTQVPSDPNATDNSPYEMGVKFRSAKAGQITAIRYWRSTSETGTHVGKIWAATGGSPLASVTFSSETASGWQEQALSTPVNIQADTIYVVSVNCNSHFPITYDALASSVVTGDLSSVADNNGVFGSPNSLPTNSYRNSNYFRDLVFVASSVPTITKVSGDDQSGTAGNTLPNDLVVKITDGAGNPQAGVTVNFAVTSGGGSVSPPSAVTAANGQASTSLKLGAIPGAIDSVTNTVTATASGIGSVTFTATANPPATTNNQTVFTNQTPSIANGSDGVPYELGMKFRSAKAGQITAIRYWKAASESGTHIGKIWTASGSTLATVTFASETASGWQVGELSTSLSIEANTTYLVSVNCNSHYAVTPNQLAPSVTNLDLSSVADGNNGVFGNPNSLPNNSWNNSNYFRDVVFVAGSTIVQVSGDNQSGSVGATLPNPLVVRVESSTGSPQAGVTVNFNVTSGGGSVSPTNAVTSANGQASTTLTLGSVPSGQNNATIVSATVPGIGNVTFSATAAPANANPIYIENQKAGTINWKITNQATTEIAGYAGATSVNKGSSLPIKVSLEQTGQFTIEVYRLGSYGGKGGRLIFNSGPVNGISQPACTITDPNIRLGECNWSTTYTLAVGSDWTTGLYIAKLSDRRTGKQSQVWFVVRHDSSTSDILFQSSFSTFLAYSNSSGYSLYGFNSIGGQRAYKVSLDNPFAQTTTSTNLFDSMLHWEHNMVRWLESQAYDVSYVTNLDVHANPLILRQHKVFLSVGHDEYWSMEERNGVEQARNAGVNLGFFSANTAYWRVRFENSSAGGANRLMACYKDAWSQDPPAASDPAAATNKFRSQQNNRPENALLGVMYTGDRADNLYGGFDFVVTNSSDPYYANTNLSNGNKLSLLVGFEWDAVVNNSSAPNNLVSIGQSAVTATSIDYDVPAGTNYQISNAVYYTAPSGAKVFSTGSIQWAWGLNSDGVSTPREDTRAKQITVNVLASMNARPQAPDANIIVP